MKDCFVYNDTKCRCKEGLCLDSESGCRSFVSSCDVDDFKMKTSIFTKNYKITEEHAGCFICNFEDDYICNTYNHGCDDHDRCKEIFDHMPTKK